MALHNYEASLGVFPHNSGSAGFSPQARLLPYTDQAALQKLINFSLPVFTGGGGSQVPNPALVAVFEKVVPLFLCPSDTGPQQFAATLGTPAVAYQFGANNYMMSTGSGTATNYDDRHPTDGMAAINQGIRIGDVKDGTSQTVLMSESIRGDGIDVTLPAGTTPQQVAEIPRFIPGGGNHITLAVANYSVGYGGWIDGEGDHKGRVDVTRIGPNKAEIAYSFHLPSGGIHGATVLENRVFFAASDGVYHVPVDATTSLTADKVQPVHISLGQDEETGKPFRTGAFTTMSKHVVFTVGKGNAAALCLLNAADPKAPLIKLPLNVAAAQSASTPIVVKTHGGQRLALVFHENRGAREGRPDGVVAEAGSTGPRGGRPKSSESTVNTAAGPSTTVVAKTEPTETTKPAAESLAIINLDPNGDKNLADAKIVKSLPVGASKISGHFGHHGLDFDGDRRFAFLTNPGDGTVSILDLEKLEIINSFKIGGTPSHIVAVGGEQSDH